jgi:hypothetical protein
VVSGVFTPAGRLIDFATCEESLYLKTTAIGDGYVPLPILKFYFDILLTTEENHENLQVTEECLAMFDLSKRPPCFGQPQWV